MSECCSVNARNGAAPMVMSCPVNGAPSKRVDILTVKSLVRRIPLGLPDTQSYFCDSQECEVVYFPFDTQAPIFQRGDLLVRVGVKEKEEPIPLCHCFGFTRQDIEHEAATTGVSTIAEQIRREVGAAKCACEVKNPSGKCCLGEVTRAANDAIRRA